jgi:hypothetical protein
MELMEHTGYALFFTISNRISLTLRVGCHVLGRLNVIPINMID